MPGPEPRDPPRHGVAEPLILVAEAGAQARLLDPNDECVHPADDEQHVEEQARRTEVQRLTREEREESEVAGVPDEPVEARNDESLWRIQRIGSAIARRNEVPADHDASGDAEQDGDREEPSRKQISGEATHLWKLIENEPREADKYGAWKQERVEIRLGNERERVAR